jgi:succinate dehydrogenase hydrophobic anchor subunit
MSVRPAPQVGFSLEYFLWIFMRISGLFMIVFFLIGVTGALAMEARVLFNSGEYVDTGALARWSFFPIMPHVAAYGVDSLQWGHLWWQIMQILMLFFAISHGLDGVRQVTEDYIGRGWLRLSIRSILFVLWLVFLFVGWQLIMSYSEV